MYVFLSSSGWITVDVVITVISYQEKDFEKRRENNIEELESIVEWDSFNLPFNFQYCKWTYISALNIKRFTYSIYEELFLFVTMIVHLHSQHNMICTCFKYPCGKLCRMLIDEYLSPSNMYLVTSPHHNHSVRSTPENRLMALELVTGQTSNQLSSFNRNIIQICLYLEGIGTFAKVRLFCMILKKYFRILTCSRVKKAALSCTL